MNRLADYECPLHGQFEATAPDAADTVPCPEPMHDAACVQSECCSDVRPCGLASPWLPSPVVGRVKVGTTRGRYEKAPTPYHLDTSELAEGMPLSQWKEKRRKVWRDLRWKQAKEQR